MPSGRVMWCLLCLLGLLVAGSGTSSAKLLFKSGFEPNTTLKTPVTNGNCFTTFSGTDLSTGYRWPVTLGSYTDPGQTGIQHLFARGSAPHPVTYYATDAIEQVIGPHGARTHVLHMRLNHLNRDYGANQHNFKLGFTREPDTGLYYAFWIKFDTSLLAHPRGGSEMKACLPTSTPPFCGTDLDRRIILTLDGTGPSWTVYMDRYTPNGKAHLDWSTAVPLTPRERHTLATGGWLRWECYLYRNPNHTANGRLLWRIDGRTIVDKRDDTLWGSDGTRPSYHQQVFNFPFQIYPWPPVEPCDIWVDDLEIHDAIPAPAAKARTPSQRPKGSAR